MTAQIKPEPFICPCGGCIWSGGRPSEAICPECGRTISGTSIFKGPFEGLFHRLWSAAYNHFQNIHEKDMKMEKLLKELVNYERKKRHKKLLR